MTVTVTLTFPDHAAAMSALSKLEGAAPVAAPSPAPAPAAAEKKPAAAPAAEKKPAAPKKPARTRDELDAALAELVEAQGKDAAVAIIKSVGGVAKRAEIPDDKLDAVYDAVKAAATAKADEKDEDDL